MNRKTPSRNQIVRKMKESQQKSPIKISQSTFKHICFLVDAWGLNHSLTRRELQLLDHKAPFTCSRVFSRGSANGSPAELDPNRTDVNFFFFFNTSVRAHACSIGGQV